MGRVVRSCCTAAFLHVVPTSLGSGSVGDSEFVGEFVDGTMTNRLCSRKAFSKPVALGLATMYECYDIAACDPSVATYSVRRDQAFIEELVQVCDSCQAVLLLDWV